MIDAIRELAWHGQSVWYDGLERNLLRSGALARLVVDGVRGLTTNPAIYEKAIAGTRDYDAAVAALASRGLGAKAVYEALAIEDLRAAADLLRPVYDETDGRDGFASLEVSPLVARDARGTVEEGRRLWKALARPNVFVKVPGTPEAMSAVEALTAEGINVNVTLLFSRAAYRRAAAAWMAGLEARAARGGDLSRAASVASFFVSRVDSLVDGLLDERARTAADPGRVEALRGQAGIANAKLAYQDYGTLVATARWQRLAARGARPQRVLFASTSTKDPRYPPLHYVEALVGADTVDTVPPATFEALRRGADVSPALAEDVAGARAHLAALEELGIWMDEVTDELLAEGVTKFAEPFDRLLATIDARRARPGAPAH